MATEIRGQKRPQLSVPITQRTKPTYTFPPHAIVKVLSHRAKPHVGSGSVTVQFLCKWRSEPGSDYNAFSWHTLDEFPTKSYHRVQHYINGLQRASRTLKRKVDDVVDTDSRSTSEEPFANGGASETHSPLLSSAAKSKIAQPDSAADSYNCTLKREDGFIVPIQRQNEWKSIRFPTPSMVRDAAKIPTRNAEYAIWNEFRQRLAKLSLAGTSLTVVNNIDSSTPSLNFKFIDQNKLGKDVQKAADDTVVGCGQIPGKTKQGGHLRCSPHMGQHIGCEYGAICECLEYAAVDEGRLDGPQREVFNSGERMGLPKRFPYHNPKGKRAGCLVDFYLKSRQPVYECNPKCQCGDDCKTRVVQRGRIVPLEIFKTQNRGWGLRCPVNLQRGQFIDTYRGEIITDQEADDREKKAKADGERRGEQKSVYLYTLDKFQDDLGPDDPGCYVVDGEHVGGPTRFMNHSCDPNCCQYTVSLNKNDHKVYELAFFASRFIPAGEELVFDYLDKDEEEDEEDREEAADSVAQDCKCGSENCRGTLWV